MFGKPKFYDYNHCPRCRRPAPKPNPRVCPTLRCGMVLNPFARR
ncbi:hypothetical protein ABZ572_10825 [Streptomyces sp. NPDC018338]